MTVKYEQNIQNVIANHTIDLMLEVAAIEGIIFAKQKDGEQGVNACAEIIHSGIRIYTKDDIAEAIRAVAPQDDVFLHTNKYKKIIRWIKNNK